MKKVEFLKLFESAEADQGRLDTLEADARLLELAKAVEEIVRSNSPQLGDPLDGELNECFVEAFPLIQDAHYHGIIHLPLRALKNPAAQDSSRPYGTIGIGAEVGIMASDFGRFVTFAGAPSRLRVAVRKRLKDAFGKFGYVFVPRSALNEPYTGLTKRNSEPYLTWWDRFYGHF